jgi:hypothetical protein
MCIKITFVLTSHPCYHVPMDDLAVRSENKKVGIRAKDYRKAPVSSVRVILADGLQTTVHTVRLDRNTVRPKVKVFEEPSMLLDWCIDNGVETAIVGGFDLHHTDLLLGDVWCDGIKQHSAAIDEPWGKERGTAYVNKTGKLWLDARKNLPRVPNGDMLQAGPLLIDNGDILVEDGISPEGFSATAHQFTPDPSVGRHPRSAIACDDDYIWLVVSDGRSEDESGLTFAELAEFIRLLGAKQALNLDGGSSAQLVRRGRLMNTPRGQYGDRYPEGYPIRTAIVFEKLT